MPSAANARRFFLVTAVVCSKIAHGASWTFTPQVGLSETYSTNMMLTAADPFQGWISDIAPGIQIEGHGRRFKATLDYHVDSLRYAGHPELKRNLNALTSAATVNAIDHWLFLDASANIVQRRASAFDPVGVGAANPANQSETTTVQLAPYIRGDISDIAAYQLRYDSINSRSDDATLADTRVHQWSGTLKNASPGARIGWFAGGIASEVSNDVIDSRKNARVRAGLVLEVVPTFHVSLSDGRERTNYATVDTQTRSTPGAGIEWSPSPRTQVSAQSEKRFFGTGRSVLLNHRTALTNWRYSDVKDVTALPVLLSTPGQGTIVDLMSDLLAASIPDPAARTAAVRARLDQTGTPPAHAEAGGGQTSRLFVNHARQASAALIGARNTFTLTFIRREQQSIDDPFGIIGVFSPDNNVREQEGNVSWVHRLTPSATLNLTASRLKTEGLDDPDLQTTQATQTLSVSFRMGRQTFLSVAARRVSVNRTSDGSFREKAVVFALNQRF